MRAQMRSTCYTSCWIELSQVIHLLNEMRFYDVFFSMGAC
ncbi:hypothetical protein ELY21_04745 [Legionella sp. km535]|nr:hypothetical protein ELY21_04745 [Legionella sp. km535]